MGDERKFSESVQPGRQTSSCGDGGTPGQPPISWAVRKACVEQSVGFEPVPIRRVCWRGAMPNNGWFTRLPMLRFNPRSPLPGSDARVRAWREAETEVSIHAPRCRGAMLRVVALAIDRRQFQSTLPVAGERCHRGRAGRPIRPCFNPRSPLPGSDAGARRADMPCSKAVSIHAPRCRGAMLVRSSSAVAARIVSIHAPRCRGAMPGKGCRQLGGFTFQSTLPVAGERCRGTSCR